jgi:hypothetical protein
MLEAVVTIHVQYLLAFLLAKIAVRHLEAFIAQSALLEGNP